MQYQIVEQMRVSHRLLCILFFSARLEIESMNHRQVLLALPLIHTTHNHCFFAPTFIEKILPENSMLTGDIQVFRECVTIPIEEEEKKKNEQ